MSSVERSLRAWGGWWPWASIGGGLSLAVGGMMHPDQDPTRSEAAGLADWIGDPMWVPSHSMILLSSILFGLALVGLLGHRPDLPTPARRAGWLALAGAVLSIVENVPHLTAATESPAAAAGGPTPLLATHMAVALVAFPLFGLSVGTLALLSGNRLTHPLLGVLAAIGGVAWGFAPLAVGPLAIEWLEVLFPVGMFMAVWFVVVGARALIRRRSGAEPSRAAPA